MLNGRGCLDSKYSLCEKKYCKGKKSHHYFVMLGCNSVIVVCELEAVASGSS